MTSTTSALRLTRNQLAQLTKDPEVIRQLELLIARVNALDGGGGTGAVTSVNGETGDVVLDAGDVGAVALGSLADIATSGSADDLVAGTVPLARFPADTLKRTIGCVVDGGGSAITTGLKSLVRVPFDGTITGWTVMSDVVGSVVVDVWKDSFAASPPTVADSIAGTEKPTLSSAQKAEDATLTTWTTAITAGDVLAFNVDSASTVTRVIVQLEVTVA